MGYLFSINIRIWLTTSNRRIYKRVEDETTRKDDEIIFILLIIIVLLASASASIFVQCRRVTRRLEENRRELNSETRLSTEIQALAQAHVNATQEIVEIQELLHSIKHDDGDFEKDKVD